MIEDIIAGGDPFGHGGEGPPCLPAPLGPLCRPERARLCAPGSVQTLSPVLACVLKRHAFWRC